MKSHALITRGLRPQLHDFATTTGTEPGRGRSLDRQHKRPRPLLADPRPLREPAVSRFFGFTHSRSPASPRSRTAPCSSRPVDDAGTELAPPWRRAGFEPRPWLRTVLEACDAGTTPLEERERGGWDRSLWRRF